MARSSQAVAATEPQVIFKPNDILRLKEAMEIKHPQCGKVRIHTLMKGRCVKVDEGVYTVEFRYGKEPITIEMPEGAFDKV